MNIQDRIIELRRVPAADLHPNPLNWRRHPAAQQDALRGVLADIGYAGALLARQRDDGELELIDGHLRAETTPTARVPVLIVDLDQQEAAKLLALHDPLAAMAEADGETLEQLLRQVSSDNSAVRAMLDALEKEVLAANPAPPGEPDKADLDIPAAYHVVVECEDEAEQREVYERLTEEGHRCRLMLL